MFRRFVLKIIMKIVLLLLGNKKLTAGSQRTKNNSGNKKRGSSRNSSKNRRDANSSQINPLISSSQLHQIRKIDKEYVWFIRFLKKLYCNMQNLMTLLFAAIYVPTKQYIFKQIERENYSTLSLTDQYVMNNARTR